MIQIKRIYDDPKPEEGYRILVDRLWPRGISKEDANLDEWLKEIAPSSELRQWFDHDKKKWNEFMIKYWEELREKKDLLDHMKSVFEENDTITFLFAAKNEKYNNAAALKTLLKENTI